MANLKPKFERGDEIEPTEERQLETRGRIISVEGEKYSIFWTVKDGAVNVREKQFKLYPAIEIDHFYKKVLK